MIHENVSRSQTSESAVGADGVKLSGEQNLFPDQNVSSSQRDTKMTLLTKPSDITEILESIRSDLENAIDTSGQPTVSILLNLVENLFSDCSTLKREVQRLSDMINRLKGEQGKPNIKANSNQNSDVSSEKERERAENSKEENKNRVGFRLDKKSLEKLKEQRIPAAILDQLKDLSADKYETEADFIEAVEARIGADSTKSHSALLLKYARYKKRNRKPKLPEIKIDREVRCYVDPELLPEDAVLKAYQGKIVQDLIIKTDHVRFKREVYYSPSLKKTWRGKLPEGYEGDYGPHINADILSMKYVNNMSIPKIHEFLQNFKVAISRSYISNRLTKNLAVFHQEKSDIYQASLESNSFQQIDDTSSRVNGKNHYTQIVCNDLAMLFFTTERKDRLTILDVLRCFESRAFLFNDETFDLLAKLNVSAKLIEQLHNIEKGKPLDEQDIKILLDEIFPYPDKGKQNRTRIMEAAAIAYYHQQTATPIVEILHCDDAPQFKLLTSVLSLCWVHDGRHYKKLRPIVPAHNEQLTQFRQRYWAYYRKLFEFKKNPADDLAQVLSDEFDTLFFTKTDYGELDRRIAKSQAKKVELLTVLQHPELPLHNNLSENGARVQKRREDVSLHTKTTEGTKAKDTMMSIVETCKKHGVSAYQYIADRVSKSFELPSLADLIRRKGARRLTPDGTS